MNYAVVGLGNPGEKYRHNRHNVGFMFVDFFAQKLIEDHQYENTSQNIFEQNKYLDAKIAKLELQATSYKLQTILAKPQTYMNKSGTSVKKLATSYQLPATSLFIIHDDLDIVFGQYKISWGKGPKIHNGINSIEATLKTSDFWRVRIGIDGRQGNPIPGEKYVLSDFTQDESAVLQKTIFPEITKKLLSVLD